MEERLARLEVELERQRGTLSEALRRLAEIEAMLPARPFQPAMPGLQAEPVANELRHEGEVSAPSAATLPLLGRTLVALGGAYLLRALTEGGQLSPAVGVSLGLAYAVLWIPLALRAAQAERRRSASYHLLAAAACGMPLLWETTTRLSLLPPVATAGLLVGLALALLAATLRAHLHGAAWIAALASLGTGFALLGGTPYRVTFAWTLLIVAVVVVHAARSRGWDALAWVAALLADAGVLVVGVVALLSPGVTSSRPVVVLQMALFTFFLVLFAVRLVRGRRDLDGFVLMQSLAVLAMGYGGALLVGRTAGMGPALGGVSLTLGLVCYALAFVALDRARREVFYLLSSEALLLSLGGSGLLGLDRPMVWGFLSLGLGGLAFLAGRRGLALHSAIYLSASAAASGAVGWTATALLAPAETPLAPFPWRSLLILVIGVAAVGLERRIPFATYWGRYQALPAGALALIVVWLSLGAALAGMRAMPLLAPLVADGGTLAVLRTGLLVGSAIGLLALARLPGLSFVAWHGRAALFGGGVKLLLDDLPHGRPSTLFLSLALYGLSLIAGSRLWRPDPPLAGTPTGEKPVEADRGGRT